jgi:hypothetical protein
MGKIGHRKGRWKIAYRVLNDVPTGSSRHSS